MSVSFLSLFLLIGLFVGGLFLPSGARKAGIVVVVAIVIVLGMLVSLRVARQHSILQVSQQAPSAQAKTRPIRESVFSERYPGTPPGETAALAPVWSDAMEEEFEANVYPSKSAATRALGRRIAKAIRGTMSDPNESVKVVLFDPVLGHDLAAELKRSIERQMPGILCSIEVSGRRLDNNEVTVDLRLTGGTGGGPSVGRLGIAAGPHPQSLTIQSGRVGASLWIKGQQRDILEIRFRDAPWMEDLSRFARENPWQRYVVAHSSEACTSEDEARQQALMDACGKVLKAFTTKFGWPQQSEQVAGVRPSDIQNGRFIVDQFLQSFDGSVGKIWRQAMLLDTSDSKLQWLNNRTAPVARVQVRQVQRVPWIGQVGSAIGVLVLILVTYSFLNLATRGYHRQS